MTQKKKTLYIVTAFIGEKGYKNRDTLSSDGKPPEATPKSATASSLDTNISDSVENVKEHYSREPETISELKRQNKQLRERVEYWKGQTRPTKVRTLRRDDVHKLAMELKDIEPTSLKTSEIEIALHQMGRYLLNESEVRYSDLSEMADDLAFPVKQNVNVVNVKSFDAELVILNSSDGKKYLYDIVNIKENTADETDLLKRDQRRQSAATRRSVSENNIAENNDGVKTSLERESDYDGMNGVMFSREQDAIRKKPAPKKVQWGFKLMNVDKNGLPHAMFVDSAAAFQLNTWYDASAPNMSDLEKLEPGYAYLVDADGNADIATRKAIEKKPKQTGFAKLPGKVAVNAATADGKRWMVVHENAKGKRMYYNVGINGSGTVSVYALRPGLHAVDIPSMRHIGAKSNGVIDRRRPDQRWFLIEYPVDVDYNQEAYANDTKDIQDHLPTDGWYSFQTNSGAEKHQHWFITGAMKIVGAVSEQDARAYAKQQGFEADLEWKDGKSYGDSKGAIDLMAYAAEHADTKTPSKDEMRRRIEAERDGKVSAVKFSREADAEYMAAVESGDMETVQNMVDEAARNAGYKLLDGFYVDAGFKPVRLRKDLRDKAYKLGEYIRKNVIPFEGLRFNQVSNLLVNHDIIYEVYEIDGESISYENLYEAVGLEPEYTGVIDTYFWSGYAPEFFGTPRYAFGKRIGRIHPRGVSWNYRDQRPENGVSVLGLFEGGKYVPKNDGSFEFFNHGQKYIVWGLVSTDLGSDGEHLLNLASTVGTAQSLIKSSDPVTYDDNDNVIPLSKRFDSKNEDIRYSREQSKGKEYSGKNVDWAVENGIITEEERISFFHKVADINKLGHKYRQAKNGDYIVDLGGKLLFTNADWYSPSLNIVISFNDSFESSMLYAKEIVFNEAKSEANYNRARQAIETAYWQGYVEFSYSRNYQTNVGKNAGRERADSKANHGEDVTYSREPETISELKRQNKQLRERVEYWKGQTRPTKVRTLRKDDVHKLAMVLKDIEPTSLKTSEIEIANKLDVCFLLSDRKSGLIKVLEKNKKALKPLRFQSF